MLGIEAAERRAERREQGWIGVAAGKVARVRRQRGAADHSQRRLGRNDGSAATVGADEATLLERAVGRGDGRRAYLELARQVPNGRQSLGGSEPLLGDRRLDRRRDRGGAGSAFDALC